MKKNIVLIIALAFFLTCSGCSSMIYDHSANGATEVTLKYINSSAFFSDRYGDGCKTVVDGSNTDTTHMFLSSIVSGNAVVDVRISEDEWRFELSKDYFKKWRVDRYYLFRYRYSSKYRFAASIGGTVNKVEELASTHQVAFDARTKRILIPMSNATDIGYCHGSGRVVCKVPGSRYSSPEDVIVKVLWIE